MCQRSTRESVGGIYGVRSTYIYVGMDGEAYKRLALGGDDDKPSYRKNGKYKEGKKMSVKRNEKRSLHVQLK